MALFVGMRIAGCITRAVTPYEPPLPRTTLRLQQSFRAQLAERGPAMVAVVFVWATIACALMAATGLAVIVVASRAHAVRTEPALGALMAAFIPAMVAAMLVVSVALELCAESGRCVWIKRMPTQALEDAPGNVIEMRSLAGEDFDGQRSSSPVSTVSSSSSADM